MTAHDHARFARLVEIIRELLEQKQRTPSMFHRPQAG